MLKKLSKSFIAVLLAICITASASSVALVASAASESQGSSVGGIFADIAIEKLVEVGMRTAAEICLKLGEATGTEEGEEAFSLIANWVFF